MLLAELHMNLLLDKLNFYTKLDLKMWINQGDN